MIVHAVEQGSHEWLDLRHGRPTASAFHRILTPKSRKLSDQAVGYVEELLAERWLGHALDWGGTNWTERGVLLEREAVPYYEILMDAEVERVGFVTLDDGTAGCSPDGLVGANGGLEIKCPSAAVHMKYLLGRENPAHRTQVMGGLWICEREWWDVVSYNPAFPPVRIRVWRDEAYIKDLAAAVAAFTERLAEAADALDALRDTGRIEDHWPLSEMSEGELEAFELSRRAALEAGVISQQEHDELVQLAVGGMWGELRARWHAIPTPEPVAS
jgi:hypothetical protein